MLERFLYSLEGPVAQPVEQGTFNPKVAGSNPARPIPDRGPAPKWLGEPRHPYRRCRRRPNGAPPGAHSGCRGWTLEASEVLTPARRLPLKLVPPVLLGS